jgi:hypothetical protein
VTVPTAEGPRHEQRLGVGLRHADQLGHLGQELTLRHDDGDGGATLQQRPVRRDLLDDLADLGAVPALLRG